MAKLWKLDFMWKLGFPPEFLEALSSDEQSTDYTRVLLSNIAMLFVLVKKKEKQKETWTFTLFPGNHLSR